MKQKVKYIRLSSYQDNRFYPLSKSTRCCNRKMSMYSNEEAILYYYYFRKKRMLSDMFKPRKAKPMYYYFDDLSIISLLHAAKRSFYGKFK